VSIQLWIDNLASVLSPLSRQVKKLFPSSQEPFLGESTYRRHVDLKSSAQTLPKLCSKIGRCAWDRYVVEGVLCPTVYQQKRCLIELWRTITGSQLLQAFNGTTAQRTLPVAAELCTRLPLVGHAIVVVVTTDQGWRGRAKARL